MHKVITTKIPVYELSAKIIIGSLHLLTNGNKYDKLKTAATSTLIIECVLDNLEMQQHAFVSWTLPGHFPRPLTGKLGRVF